MYTHHLAQNGPAPKAPAQTIFEFAQSALEGLQRANQELAKLRERLFGDGPDPDTPTPSHDPSSIPPTDPLQTLAAQIHWEMNQVSKQVSAIHERL